MVSVYLCRRRGCSADALVTELAKKCFPGTVPEILRAERGKPYFSGDTGIHFSVSHSGDYVAVAFAKFPVGLDLQQHKSRSYETRTETHARHKKLAARYFHPDEQALVENDSWEGFFRVWTAKESFVKRTGQGIDKVFSKICILPQGESWEDANGFFRQAEIPDGYTLTLSAPHATQWEILTL